MPVKPQMLRPTPGKVWDKNVTQAWLDAHAADALSPFDGAAGVDLFDQIQATLDQKADLDGATGAVQAPPVSHDATLTGTGRPGSVLSVAALPPIAASFTAAADAYFPTHEAMTLNAAGGVKAGVGTIVLAKALLATPTAFTTITASTTFAAGDVLKITASAVTGYVAVTIPRTA